MDNPIPRPLGLAALITATVTLLSTGAMEQAGQPGKQNLMAQQPSNGLALSSNAFSPSVVTALQSSGPTTAKESARSRGNHQAQLSQPSFKKQQLQGQRSHPELPQTQAKELPVDIRSARLMLSVESLFKATTAN